MTNGRTDGKTDGRTNNPEAICPSNFFEVGGIKKKVKTNQAVVCRSCDLHLRVKWYELYEISITIFMENEEKPYNLLSVNCAKIILKVKCLLTMQHAVTGLQIRC